MLAQHFSHDGAVGFAGLRSPPSRRGIPNSARRGIQEGPMGSSRPPTPGAPRNGLPVQLTSFVGRDREIGAVKDLLARARLVTLVGPGGAARRGWRCARRPT